MSDSSYRLTVKKGPKPGQVFSLSLRTISLGRDPMSDISISDPEVSRYHAQLRQTETGYQIQDMGSTNGTFVDGEHLGPEPFSLLPGQTIQLGSGVLLLYELSEEVDAMMATAIESPASAEPLGAARSAASSPPPLPSLDGPQATPDDAYEPPLASAPLVAPVEGGGRNRQRRNVIIIVSALLLLCCCCAFLISGYYVWGDPLLELLLDLGLLDWLREFGVSI